MAQTLVNPKMLDTGNLEVGFTNTEYNYGTLSSGTTVVDFTQSPQAYATNGGSFTLNPPASGAGAQDIVLTNNGSAGTVTTSGFTVVKGDSLDTTDTNKFLLQIKRINSISVLIITALQ